MVRTLTFGFPKTYQYSLQSVQGAYVAPSDQSDAIRLELGAGTNIQLTPYSDMEGKSQAAYAINRF